MSSVPVQAAWPIRFEWGMTGARRALVGAPPQTTVVVVDVLSFTTAVTAAVERGAQVVPTDPGGVARHAAAPGAILAVGRDEHTEGDVTLSPLSMTRLRRGDTLVLPSPNGSRISDEVTRLGFEVVAGCLRNAKAVATHLATQDPELAVVVAAGERWPDGTLRPALEDLWGAGGVLHHLAEVLGPLGYDKLSPEARFAADAFSAARRRMHDELPIITSGLELVAKGFAGDVDYAADTDATCVVPVLVDGAFTASR